VLQRVVLRCSALHCVATLSCERVQNLLVVAGRRNLDGHERICVMRACVCLHVHLRVCERAWTELRLTHVRVFARVRVLVACASACARSCVFGCARVCARACASPDLSGYMLARACVSAIARVCARACVRVYVCARGPTSNQIPKLQQDLQAPRCAALQSRYTHTILLRPGELCCAGPELQEHMQASRFVGDRNREPAFVAAPPRQGKTPS
jgi:hypothetical protein